MLRASGFFGVADNSNNSQALNVKNPRNIKNRISKKRFRIKKKGLLGNPSPPDAAMGIRTPVASVRGSHDWPDYTIAAQLLNTLGDIFT